MGPGAGPKFDYFIIVVLLVRVGVPLHTIRGVLAQNLKSVQGDCKGARGAKIQNGQQGKYGRRHTVPSLKQLGGLGRWKPLQGSMVSLGGAGPPMILFGPPICPGPPIMIFLSFPGPCKCKF